MNKRGYFVHCGDDDAGFAVVAMSAKEAKKIAYNSGELDTGWNDVEWINIRCRWKRNADVFTLPIGMIEDARVGLLCGMYEHLEEYPCDECGNNRDVQLCDGQILCECCIKKNIQLSTDVMK